jgi:hypothetical protein
MPKLPFKRKAADDENSLSAYIPAHMVDYTSLPPIEEDSALTRFKRQPLIVRLGAVLLPLLLLVGIGWTAWQYLGAEPTEAVAPPKPVVTIDSATVVSPDAIVVEARVENAANGTPVTGLLLLGETPTKWADPAASNDVVTNGKVTLRLGKAEQAEVTLDEKASYLVEITVGQAADAVSAKGELSVPEKLRSAFFGTVIAEATPEPTAAPTPEPTPEPQPTPEPAGPPTLEVTVASTLLISPTLGVAPLAEAPSGATFQPLMRTANNEWYLVQQNDTVGWLHGDQVAIDAKSNAAIRVVTPDAAAVAAGPLKATVFNGGNIRYRADVKTGTVLGQLHAGQEVTIVARTADSQWIHVIAPEAEGFVSVSLLTIDPQALSQAPVTQSVTLDVQPVGAAPPTQPAAASAPSATDGQTAASGGSNGAVADSLTAAFDRSQLLSAYRFEFVMSGKVPLAALPTSANAANTTLLELTGAASGKNIHLTLKGLALSFLGGDVAKGVQAMVVDQTLYIHGPLSFGGMTEDRWYKLSGSAASQFKSVPIQPSKDRAQANKIVDSGFKVTGEEMLDGQQCKVYSANKAELIKMFEEASKTAPSSQIESFQDSLDEMNLDKLDISMWTCADGFFHQLTASIAGRGKSTSSQDFTLDLKLRLYDLNQKINIVAPADAKPLDDFDISGLLSGLNK